MDIILDNHGFLFLIMQVVIVLRVKNIIYNTTTVPVGTE
jgi:hypothetical protein